MGVRAGRTESFSHDYVSLELPDCAAPKGIALSIKQRMLQGKKIFEKYLEKFEKSC